jgi:hypothetical protein
MASWKHDVCKLRSYYSFLTLFLWAVPVWVYDEFINSNWQFAVTNNRLTFVSFHIVFLSFCWSWENVTLAPAYKILLRRRKNRRSSGRTPAHSTKKNCTNISDNSLFRQGNPLNWKGTFAPLAPPGKGQRGQLPLLPPPPVPASLWMPFLWDLNWEFCFLWNSILNV